MVELVTYADDELPADLKCQVLSFQRIQWPEGFVGVNRLRDWIHHPELHPAHFVLVENGVLISYAGVLWKDLEHAGAVYKTYELSGVLTYRAFGRQGYGRRVVAAATAYIREATRTLDCSPAPHTARTSTRPACGSPWKARCCSAVPVRAVPERGTGDDGLLLGEGQAGPRSLRRHAHLLRRPLVRRGAPAARIAFADTP